MPHIEMPLVPSSPLQGKQFQLFILLAEKWNICCHISKQRMPQSSAIAATTDGKQVSPEGTEEGKNTCHLGAINLQPLPMVSPEET